MAMKSYTAEIHIERLREMMSKTSPCLCCPAAPGYSASYSPTELWKKERSKLEMPRSCSVCREFVGLNPYRYNNHKCPCFALGKEEALARTIKKLEELEEVCDG